LLGLVWWPRTIPMSVGVITAVALLAGFALQRAARGRASFSLWASAAVVLTFAAGSQQARALLAGELARAVPHERSAQLVLSPLPSNPLCWTGLSVSSDPAGLYHARFARISLLPSLWPNARCGNVRGNGATTAPLRRSSLRSSTSAIAFELELSAPLAELHALRARACEVDAALRFMRAPYWDAAATPPIIGDLRYDSEPQLGFAELEAPNDCRDAPPRWVPPLDDLLKD
jgi:inner membrane protein